jgi:adenylosuccinate synthase
MPTSWQVVDLGYGDAGKGRVVDALVRSTGAKLVVRYGGGAQAAHNVVDGQRHHTFRQFGSGTFAGADTLLGPCVLVNPIMLMKESDELAAKGVGSPDRLVKISERARLTLPYHVALNRLRELSRGIMRHGSCGMGIGETAAQAIRRPEVALQAWECLRDMGPVLTRVDSVRVDLLPEAERLAALAAEHDPDEAERHLRVFHVSPAGLAGALRQFADRFEMLSERQERDVVSSRDTVFEGAQGVLIDQEWGFAPHNTWTDTTLAPARAAVGPGVVRYRIGVVRPYMVRHGHGPLPTSPFPAGAAIRMFPDHNQDNPWQGYIRRGWLDLPALRYAIAALGEPLDALAVTHCDELALVGKWGVAVEDPAGDAPWQDLSGAARTEAFSRRRPNLDWWLPDSYLHRMEQGLGVPVGVEAWGPSAQDKIVYNIPALC